MFFSLMEHELVRNGSQIDFKTFQYISMIVRVLKIPMGSHG